MLRICSQVGDLRSLAAHLIRLDLSNNGITDTIFAESCQLTSLKWLSLASNPITSLQPLQCLTNLQACALLSIPAGILPCLSVTRGLSAAAGAERRACKADWEAGHQRAHLTGGAHYQRQPRDLPGR